MHKTFVKHPAHDRNAPGLTHGLRTPMLLVVFIFFAVSCCDRCIGARNPGGLSAAQLPPLALVEELLFTTARDDFEGSDEDYLSAVKWSQRKLDSRDYRSPHIACFAYQSAAESFALLNSEFPSESVQRVSLRTAHGPCFLITVPNSVVAATSEGLHGLKYFGPLPSALKFAPGLIEHNSTKHVNSVGLATTHGEKMRSHNVVGLNVHLSPGCISSHNKGMADSFSHDLLMGLSSSSIDLHGINFWSDTAESASQREHHSCREASALRAREWTRAADLIHGLSGRRDGRITAAAICGWGSVAMHYTGNGYLVTGLNHLLYRGRGAGGSTQAESDELKMACFMGLVSYFASIPEVLRVAPFHKPKFLNAVAKAISQSATITDTPLTEAGLDGTGEVIQIVDSGVDQESCFFRDGDGQTVEGGFLFQEILMLSDGSVYAFNATGSFPYDLDRRKIVQYISLVRPDIEGVEQPYGDSFTSTYGNQYPFYETEGFATEEEGGHGSHTAGTAAGATVTSPAQLGNCAGGEELGCVGSCLNSSYIDQLTSNELLNIDTMCPNFDCDGAVEDYPYCLTDDVPETLSAHGGVAPGAKLAVYDVSVDGEAIWAVLALNELWMAANETGCVIHSNSWGGDGSCAVDSASEAFDAYMYENPENLLIFAVGNEGDSNAACTVGSPAVGKNVLSVGASSSGPTRWSATDSDGNLFMSSEQESSDIDTVAFFSSYGPTPDNRIKPEIVAPGDRIMSVSSAAEDVGPSCRLELQAGTSQAAPVVAGSAAIIRQYFKDNDFYVKDLEARGLCSANNALPSPFICAEFEPSSATVKALLINSANLMGGSSEPDNYRGFGRVHLEAGLPLEGSGQTALFVADSMNTSATSGELTSFAFETVESEGVEFRATLAWIDPPASAMAVQQLIHDLDLLVTSPSGKEYTMWLSGEADSDNVIERVIVSAENVAEEESGTWMVSISPSSDFSDAQPYSLVVTGPFSLVHLPEESEQDPTSAATWCHHLQASRTGGLPLLLALVGAVMATTCCVVAGVL